MAVVEHTGVCFDSAALRLCVREEAELLRLVRSRQGMAVESGIAG
jgi:hypothetical protein